MQHRVKTRKLGRKKEQKEALLRSLGRALVLHEKIETTEAKAKELRPFIEKLVTKSKEGTLSTRRLVISRIGGEEPAQKLFDIIAPRYKERNGGYTRIVKVAPRQADGARLAIIEFV